MATSFFSTTTIEPRATLPLFMSLPVGNSQVVSNVNGPTSEAEALYKIARLPKNQKTVTNLLSVFDSMDAVHKAINNLHYQALQLDKAIRELLLGLGSADKGFSQQYASALGVAHQTLAERLMSMSAQAQDSNRN